MPDTLSLSPEAWRNYSNKSPIPACRLTRDDLKRLYQAINEKQLEYRDKVLERLTKLPTETDEGFTARTQKVRDAFVTSVTITGVDGEAVHGNNEAFFGSASIPERLRSILFSTITIPQVMLNFRPLCNAIVFLDFSQPPLFDFNRLPSFATPNESNFALEADNESWFAALNTRLTKFFSERKTRSNWLHQAAIYDLLLMFIGLPACIWADYRLGYFWDKGSMASIIVTATYVYLFVAMVQAFRLLFSYSRWVFPKVELASDLASSPLRHRYLWGVLFLGIATAFLYDIVKFIAGQ